MITPAQAFELERLQRRLRISDGALLDFSQQYSFDREECQAGKNLFTLDRLTAPECQELIRALRLIDDTEIRSVPELVEV